MLNVLSDFMKKWLHALKGFLYIKYDDLQSILGIYYLVMLKLVCYDFIQSCEYLQIV